MADRTGTPGSESGCTETLREVEAFLDGEVDPAMSERIARHLADCSPCMDRADFRQHVKEIVRSRCAGEAVPEALDAKVRALIRDDGS